MKANKSSKEYKSRKKIGQFFTEEKLVLEIVKKFNLHFDNKTIIEPSCGNGSFINGIINTNEKFNKIIGIDIDKKALSNLHYDCNVELVKKDFLKFKTKESIDMIIGNPPFNLPEKDYIDSTEGFVLKSIELLSENGELVLILPNTIFRNKKYENLRKTIIEKTEIVGIINTFGYEFLGADIETVALYLRKKKVESQKYFYFNGTNKKIINLEINSRFNISIDNKKIFNEINDKITGKPLGELFEIQRGRGTKIKGRYLDFYDMSYITSTGADEFIGIQNIAYRFTANYIKSNMKDVSDTITCLIPKEKIDDKKLMMISSYLNSSVAYYQLHVNSLNFSKLTIHMDKYYIDDLLIPNFTNSECNKFIQESSKVIKSNDFSKFRNEYFYKYLNLDAETIKEIELYWTDPKFKKKEVI